MANVTGMAIYAFSHEATIQQVTDGYKAVASVLQTKGQKKEGEKEQDHSSVCGARHAK